MGGEHGRRRTKSIASCCLALLYSDLDESRGMRELRPRGFWMRWNEVQTVMVTRLGEERNEYV